MRLFLFLSVLGLTQLALADAQAYHYRLQSYPKSASGCHVSAQESQSSARLVVLRIQPRRRCKERAGQLFLFDGRVDDRVHAGEAFGGGDALCRGKRSRKLRGDRLSDQKRNGDDGQNLAAHFSGWPSTEFRCCEDTFREAKSANDL